MEPPKPNLAAAMESWSDRDWSVYAVNKALESNAVVGGFGDQLRELKMWNTLMKDDVKKLQAENTLLKEQLELVLSFLLESGSAAAASPQAQPEPPAAQ